jgi:hypothetical protein
LTESEGLLGFKTPEAWLRTPGVKARYEDVHFDRNSRIHKKGTILGVGTRLFDAALEQACQLPEAYAVLPNGAGTGPLLVFRSYDRVTGNPAQPKSIILGVACDAGGDRLLKDWEVLQWLNDLSLAIKPSSEPETILGFVPPGDGDMLSKAEALVRSAFSSLDLPFRQPELELLGVIGFSNQTSFR